MDEHKAWLAGVFDRAAPTYDRIGDAYHRHFARRLVELLRRYSNRPDMTKSIQDVLRGVEERDQTDVPGVLETGQTGSGRRRLTSTETDELVERFKAGDTIWALAERHGISQSWVKVILRRRDVGKADRY